MPVINHIHHVAMVVDDLDKSLLFWRDALGLKLTDLREVREEISTVAFLPTGEAEIELVKPTSTDSGIARFLASRGPGLHHICLEVDDLAEMLKKMKEKGVRLINEEPRSNPDGRRYAFIHPESTGGVLVELYESL